jgi:predicted Zn-dependent protease
MTRKVRSGGRRPAAALLLALALAVPVAALAAGGAPGDEDETGLALDPPGRAIALVSAEQIEREASERYQALLVQAGELGALAAEDDPRLQRLRSIAKQLIARVGRYHADAPKWDWQVNLIDSEQINAFCMPGGKIAFYSGIVDRLQLTDDEIAIVMGHEIAHALREHGREQAGTARIARGLTMGASFLSQLFGWGDLGGYLASGAARLTLLQFGREDESEADLIGMDLAARAGFDPRAGIVLWQKMAAVSKGQAPRWLSTHPPHTARMEDLRRSLQTALPLYAQTRGMPVDKLPPYRSAGDKTVR